MSKLSSLAAALGEPKPVEKLETKETKILSSKADKFEQLAAITKKLNKEFKTEASIVRLGGKVGVAIPSIPTNLVSLDVGVLECGGIPRGRIIEIYGPESSGKTTISLHIIAEEQQNTDNLCAFVDAEHALDPNYASKLGVNVDELLVSQPDSGEQALTIVEELIDSRAVSIIVVDSVAALVPQAELDGEMGDSNIGLQARLMSQAMRKLRAKANENQVTVIFINQIREKVGVMFGSPEVTTGGRALKFFASVRLDCRKREIIGTKEEPLGHILELKAVKNKVGVPFRSTKVNLLYGIGIDKDADFVDYAIKQGVIVQAGRWYKFNEENIAGSLTDAVECVKKDKELMKKIKEKFSKKD